MAIYISRRNKVDGSVMIFKGLGVGTQHLIFNIALRVEVVERTRHKEHLIQLNVLISLSQSH